MGTGVIDGGRLRVTVYERIRRALTPARRSALLPVLGWIRVERMGMITTIVIIVEID